MTCWTGPAAMMRPRPITRRRSGGLGHLAHQVRGEEDGSSFGGQGTHELANPLHALGVEPVDRLVEDERPGVA